jgi:dipeptidyl aminopeptidase/acylaminoacyl peptidase
MNTVVADIRYEGGDNTWEDEYLGNKTRWPLGEEDQNSDVYNHLASITSPLLLMHGEDDDICPLSQSLVAYRVLQQSGVPTGLVVYPKEKHGFDKPEHRQDRDRRMLCWLAQYMPSETCRLPAPSSL